MRFFKTLLACIFFVAFFQPSWAVCPFDAVGSDFKGPMAGVPTVVNVDFAAVLFRSGLEIDYDGAPTAYHKGNVDESNDPGLDHICNGGSVLEFQNDRLVNKYGSGGSIGSLSGIDPKSNTGRSKLCKLDYIELRDKGFPPCSPTQNCMLFYGIKVEPRPCGYDSPFGGPNDRRCGVPILQQGADGKPLDFYLTTTAHHRPGTSSDSLKQSDFVDASKIPFIVMPGGQKLPGDIPYDQGDIAVVIRGEHLSYAVVGDTGPSGKIGEASAAVFWQLNVKGPIEFARKPATMTLVFPGTSSLLKKQWPIDPSNVKQQARLLLQQMKIKNLRACEGLERLE